MACILEKTTFRKYNMLDTTKVVKRSKHTMSKKIVSILISAALIAACTAAFTSCGKDPEVPTVTEGTTASEEATTQDVRSGTLDPLTGKGSYDEKYVGKKPVAIVVENSPAARPQWGMTTPDMLVEYEVEGGITRMLWLYSNIDKVPDKVGPVRSARHDVVELALGLDALFVHCGGSNFAYDKINTYKGSVLSEIDGMQSQPFFERNQTRNVASEHRLVLRGDGIRSWIESKNINMTLNEAYKNPFSFNASAVEPSGKDCVSAEISFSAYYNYEFKYDATAKKYNCFINSSERIDDSGTQCSYDNVVVLYVDMEAMGTSSGHQNLKLENGGTGLFVSQGKCEEIKWTKGTDREMLKLMKADGSVLSLNPGNTYIGFVRSTQQSATVTK